MTRSLTKTSMPSQEAACSRRNSRQSRAHRPYLERLDGRLLLSNVTFDPSYADYPYQPLNGDTKYQITGLLQAQDDSTSNANSYGFYESAGDHFTVSGAVSLPSGDLGGVDITGPGVDVSPDQNNGVVPTQTITAPVSGVYVLTVGASRIDLPVLPASYHITLTGTHLPGVAVDTPDKSGDLYISTDPAMPDITAHLTITPDPKNPPSAIQWTANVQFVPQDDPHAQQLAASTLTMQKQTTDSVVTFGQADSPSGAIQGGRLTVAATATIGGSAQTWSTSTTPNGKQTLMVVGENPSPAQIDSYVESLGTPALVAGSTYNFANVLKSIIFHESSYEQFLQKSGDSNGLPKFSKGNDDGVGLTQVTPPGGVAPSQPNLWNWQANITAGFNILVGNLHTEAQHLANDLAAIANAHDITGLTIPQVTPDVLLESAISLYGPTQKGRTSRNFYYDYTYVAGHRSQSVLLSVTPNPYVQKILKIYNDNGYL